MISWPTCHIGYHLLKPRTARIDIPERKKLVGNRFHPLFADLPVESLVHEHQSDYYQALQKSTDQADSASFIELMPRMILDAVSTATPQVAPQVAPQVERMLAAMQGEMSREQLQSALDLHDRKSFLQRYLQPALKEGLIEMTIPDKPNSRLKKYRKCRGRS